MPGNTTLLKEIVVSNIIERAILLSEYENPEKAFEQHWKRYAGCSNQRNLRS